MWRIIEFALDVLCTVSTLILSALGVVLVYLILSHPTEYKQFIDAVNDTKKVVTEHSTEKLKFPVGTFEYEHKHTI